MVIDERDLDKNNADNLKALESFVVDNDDLLALESIIGRFNIFDALGIARAEIRHSNFLAFILDPAESHGQGQVFLKAVLMDLLKSAPPNLRPFSPIELDGTDLRGIVVRREWEHIDLLISCQEPPFVVVVENKVDSKEHSNQLSRYQDTMKRRYPNHRPLFVYLTPDGEEPSEETWVPYSYQDLYNVLKRLRETYRKAIGDDVLVFLDHYLKLIGTRFMNDEQLDELCRRIYKNHRQALDLIYERAGSPESGALVGVLNALENDPRWHVQYRSSKYVDFLPLEWLSLFGADGFCPLIVHVKSRDESLIYTMFVGPMENAPKRTQIVAKLREEGPGLGLRRSKAREIDDKWARISAAETIMDWVDDDEPDLDRIHAAVKQTLDNLYPKLGKMELLLRPLFEPDGKRVE